MAPVEPPPLSQEAWALLLILHRASQGGPPAPDWEVTLEELRRLGLVDGRTITELGEDVLRTKFPRDI